jgi:hypothetical protein
MRSLRSLSLVVAFVLATVAAPVRAGNLSTAGVAIGFARVNLGDGSVAAFGGRGTQDVTTGPTSTGLILYFNGRYPKAITRDVVIAQATAEGDADHPIALANAIVSIAGRDQIAVSVNGWNGASSFDGYVFVTLYVGLVPKP